MLAVTSVGVSVHAADTMTQVWKLDDVKRLAD